MLALRNRHRRGTRIHPRSAARMIVGVAASLSLGLAACGSSGPVAGAGGSSGTSGGQASGTSAASTGGSSGSSGSSGSTTSTAGTSTSSGGGTVTFAESAGYTPTWILPFYSGEFFTIQEQGWFENLMWPPLFNQGNGESPSDNFTDSLGNQPTYSDGGTLMTLTIKHWKWSDGKPITTRDLMFWINLLKANKTLWADYTPGEFPDNVKSMKVVNPYELTMKLEKPYSASFFTLDELSQITPIPQHIWDRESASGPVGNYDQTTKGAKAVLSFLESQSKDLRTYASNPLWKVVDGPWNLTGYTLTGQVTFTPNKLYSGPAKPKIAKFEEVPFTSADAEYNSLRSGQLDVGYIPANNASTIPEVKQLGYNVGPWEVYGFNSLFINFNNPTVGPIFKQLYVRQAMQYLVNQPLYIKEVDAGFAQPDYGPVVNGPSSLTEPSAEPDAYPYDPAKAKTLLASHGWTVKPGGTSTCSSPGSGPTHCGAGISSGAALSFNLLIYSGSEQQQQQMTSYKTTAATVGMNIKLANNVNVFAAAPACTSKEASCSWQIADWGGGVYTPPNGFPVEAGYFDCNGNNNHENYCDPEQDKLDSAAASGGSVTAWEHFISTQLPMIWNPNADFEILAVKKTLTGPLPANTTLSVFPESWSFSK